MYHLLALACAGLVAIGVLAVAAGTQQRTPPAPPLMFTCAETWDGRPEAPPHEDCARH